MQARDVFSHQTGYPIKIPNDENKPTTLKIAAPPRALPLPSRLAPPDRTTRRRMRRASGAFLSVCDVVTHTRARARVSAPYEEESHFYPIYFRGEILEFPSLLPALSCNNNRDNHRRDILSISISFACAREIEKERENALFTLDRYIDFVHAKARTYILLQLPLPLLY